MSTFKVKATKTSTGLQVAAGTRGFEITFDEPNSTNTGMNPVEVLLTSFGACTAITANELAKKNNFDLRAFWIEIEGDLGREDVAEGDNRSKFTEIRFTPHLRTDESDEDIQKFMAEVERKCPVRNTIEFGTKFIADGFVRE